MIVIDDVLSAAEHKALHDFVMSPYYSWYWNDTSTSTEPLTENAYNYQQFIHGVIKDGLIVCQDSVEEFSTLFQKLGCREIIRCKINLIFIHPDMGDKLHGAPHVDMDDEMTTAIYYINETDGDTFFFEDEVTRVSPKPNRAVIFNSMIKHAGSPPKIHKRRVVININYR